jgi:hypothetical protein
MDVQAKELDTSGSCSVTYKTINPQTFIKTKTDCIAAETVPYLKHPHAVLGVNVTSARSATYTLSKDLSMVDSVVTEETHELSVNLKQDAGGSVTATQQLVLTGMLHKVFYRTTVIVSLVS